MSKFKPDICRFCLRPFNWANTPLCDCQEKYDKLMEIIGENIEQ